MPTIIDSLFLELGIDSSKFSKDQATALAKIQRFESETKRAASNARDGIKTVGEAFKDLTKDSRIGASAGEVEKLAGKFKALGMSMSVSGGATGGVGSMVMGLGRLLGPVGLGVAAVGLLGREMWSLNKEMTATNATIFRQSQLSDMSAKSLWQWGEAAKTVGANPQDVTGGISGLQTAIAGMGIGAADATPQLIALSRLGLGYNFKDGMTDAQVGQMFETVHSKAAKSGFKNLGQLRALTSPIMNDAMFAIATNPEYDPKDLQKWISGKTSVDTGDTLRKSLKSQDVLGRLGIQKDVLAETAYGGEQGLLQAIVTILTSLLGQVTKITDFFIHPVEGVKKVWDWEVEMGGRAIEGVANAGKWISSLAIRNSMSGAMSQLMGGGMSKDDAAAIVGNMAQESSMNPLASNAGHFGLMQWDTQRQADFARRFGYQMGSSTVLASQQFKDQLWFAQEELASTQWRADAAMRKARTLMGKTGAFMNLAERPGDNSLAQRMSYAQDAAGMMSAATGSTASVHHVVTSETHVGDIHVHTPSNDPKAHADAVRKSIANPLSDPNSQAVVSLATRGMAG